MHDDCFVHLKLWVYQVSSLLRIWTDIDNVSTILVLFYFQYFYDVIHEKIDDRVTEFDAKFGINLDSKREELYIGGYCCDIILRMYEALMFYVVSHTLWLMHFIAGICHCQ